MTELDTVSTWAERWAERAWLKIVRRIVHRIALLKSHGHDLSPRALLSHNLAAYRDLVYMSCLRMFFLRGEGRR